MGNSPSAPSESRVVIIGGGYGGIDVAIKLDNYCHVVLIDPKQYFHHCIASLRAAVSPSGFEKKVLIPYEPALKNGEFKQGTVIGVNTSEKYVTLQSEERVQYDYLVFACGSSNDFPGISVLSNTTWVRYITIAGNSSKCAEAFTLWFIQTNTV